MKFIKFNMRDKKLSFTLPMKKAEQVLNALQQTVMVTNEDGSWSGIFVNKADISSTDRDYEAEKEWRMKNPLPVIEPPVTPITPEHLAKLDKQVKEILKKARV